MKDEELVEAIRRAERIVSESGLDADSPRGAAAFAEVLKKALSADPQQANPIVQQQPGEESEDGPVTRVARWVEVSESSLLDALEFGENEVEFNIWHGRLPKQKSERQRVLALAKLGVERVGYGREEVGAREVGSLCEKYECLDQNIPTNIQQKNLISRRGKRGSYSYRLTLAGIDASRDALRSLTGAD